MTRNRTRVGLWLALTAVMVCVPSFAQLDLSGTWLPQYWEDQPERIPGPELVDYLGIPINDAARQWALSWDPDRLGLQEHQCQVHTAAYIYRGPLQLRIWENAILKRKTWSPSATTSVPMSKTGPFGWMADRILRNTRRTPG